MNQPSPYFIRRTAVPEKQVIDLHEFAAVDDPHPLRDYWLIVKRHRWLIIACAVVLFITAALYSFTRTPLYTAEATLLIERKAPQILKLQDTRAESIESSDFNNEFFKTQYEILKSQPLAERVIRDEGLQNLALFGGHDNPGTANKRETVGLVSGFWSSIKRAVVGFSYPEPKKSASDPALPNPALSGAYLSMLDVKPVRGTGLVQIKFTTPDPTLSARLANAHAFTYVRYGLDLRSQTNDEAAQFLQKKLLELKERVEQSEAALNSYRRDKGIISVDEKSNVVLERLLDLNKSLTSAEGERIGLEAQVRAVRGRKYDELPVVRSSKAITDLKSELTKFEAEYASLAKEFLPGYPLLDNSKARMDETRQRLNSEIEKEVKGIEAAYAAATNKEAQLRRAMDEQKKATLNLKDSAVQYAILAREVDTNKQLYDGVLQRLKELGVAGEVRTSNIYVMGKATPPLVPSSPNKKRIMFLGLLFGLAGGVGLAFLLEQLDNTFKTPEEAERFLRVPSLAVVPDFASLNGTTSGYVSRLVKSAQAELPVSPRKPNNGNSRVLLDHHPLSLAAEAYRSFRSALLLSQAGGPPHTVLLTSAARGDGKTTTLVNTAIVFSQLGIRVLIIDADLRRPHCHMLLRIENLAGLSDVLAGQIELDKAIRPTPVDNLFVITAGALPPNPAELLGSNKMHDILEELRQQFNFIFVDSSPLLAVSDAVFLSTMVDGTLLVVNRRTPKPLVRKARARLTLTQNKILGLVLNRVDINNNEYSGYYKQYYEYYSEDSPAKRWNRSILFGDGNGRLAHKDPHAAPPPPKPRRSDRVPAKSANNGFGTEVEIVRTKFTQAMGPIAPSLLDEHICAMGECAESFPPARVQELVQRLSKEILDDSMRKWFQVIVMNEIGNARVPQV